MRQARSHVADTAALHFDPDRRFWLPRAFGAVLFATVGATTARTSLAAGDFVSAGALLGTFTFAFFGIFAAYGIREGLRPGPRLTLDEHGVHDRTMGVGPIPWSDIAGAELCGIPQAPFVALHLREPAKYLGRAPMVPRLLSRLNAASGMTPFSVNLMGLKADPGTVTCTIRSRARTAALDADG